MSQYYLLLFFYCAFSSFVIVCLCRTDTYFVTVGAILQHNFDFVSFLNIDDSVVISGFKK